MPGAKYACTILAALMALALAATAQAASYPSGFEERTLVGGLTVPTAVDWTPDGRAVILEKSGLVKVALPGATSAETVLDLRNRVNDHHDRGALGIAVDKQFATNPYVYVLYTYELNPIAPDGGGEMVSQLLRVRLTADNKMVDEQVILGSRTTGICPAAANNVDCIPSDYDSHSIGTVVTAPDGTIYAGSGDGASYNTADTRALRSLDERSLAGKIVRIDRNGRGLPGHALCPSTTDLSAVCTKVHARGFRNPFRFALQPDGRTLTVGDVGWNTTEEVDLVGQAGRSYGWPCYEGSGRTPGYRDFSQCRTEYGRPAGTHTTPSHEYCHCGAGASVQGGPTYTDDQYPAGYRSSIFYADYSQGWIKRLEPSGSGFTPRNFATGWVGAQLTTAPSGDLAYVSFGTFAPGTGSIQEIRYVAGNRAPVARAVADRTSGSAPLTVALDARSSTDADNDQLTYSWSFGDGTPGSSAANPTHTYTRAGTYTATVTVTDARGATDQASVVITAGNDAPVAKINAPADNAPFTAGAPVQLSGAGTDTQDGALPGTALSWRIVLHHNDHIHPLTDLTGATPTFLARDDHDADSFYEITLTVRDSAGLQGTQTVRINPRTVPLSLQSQPAGAQIDWAGLDHTAPYTATAAVGFKTEVSAAPTLVSGNKTLQFARWSDGVTERTRPVTVPDAALSLTAIYEDTAPAPVVAYSFDTNDGTTATDKSGRGNHGTIRGAAWTAGGKFSGAMRFDGADDWVTLTDRAALDMTSAYSMSAWVKPDVVGRWSTLIMKEAPGTFSYALYSSSDSPAPSAWIGDTSLYGAGALPTSSWSHLTVTVGGGTQRLYLNGVQVASGPAPAAAPSNDPLRIGGNGVWDFEWFKGDIDEVRIYDRTLDAAQVVADRDTGIGGGTVEPEPEPSKAPVGAWGFDETSGTTARDASGKGHDGAISGATRTTGRFGGGLSFDGANDWVTIADHNDLDLTSPYTLEAWVKPRTRGRWQTILLKELGTTLSYALYASSDSEPPSAWNGPQSVYGTAGLPLGEWRHVAVSVGGTTQRLYIDGTQVASAPASFAPTGSGPLRIGGNSIWTEFFDGTLDEIRVYPRALTQSEIVTDRLTPINEGAEPEPEPEPELAPVAAYGFGETSGTTAADGSGHGHTGTVRGATWTAAGKNGGALHFDGVDDWVTVADHPALDVTGRWSLSAWVKPESDARWQSVILKEDAPGLSYALYSRSDAADPSGWTNFSSVYGTSALALNQWAHLTVTFGDGMMRLYVNGALVRTTTGAVAPTVSNQPLRIGGNAVWGEWFKGAIDDVRVYDRALAAAEVTADMNAGVPAAPAPAARAATARTASASAPVVARAAALRGRGRATKVSVMKQARKVATQKRAAKRNRLTRKQKAAAVRKAIKRLEARRAAARRKAGRAPVANRRQKAAKARKRR